VSHFLRAHRVFILIFAFLLLCETWFVLYYADPEFNFATCTPDHAVAVQCHNQLADIFRYYRYATENDVTSRFAMFQRMLDGTGAAAQGVVGGIGLTNIFIFFLIDAGRALTPWAPFVGIFWIQMLSLPIFYAGIRRIGQLIPEQFREAYYAGCLLVPMLPASLINANKEYWSVFFVVLMGVCALEHRRILLLALSLISTTVREVNFPIGIFFFLLTFPRVRFWHLAVLLSFAIPAAALVIPGFAKYRLVWSQWTNQGAATILGPLAEVQNYPFGQLLAAPIIFLINVISPGFGSDARISLEYGVMGAYGYATSLTSYLVIIFGLQALYLCWKRKLWTHPLVEFLGSIIILTAILPLNQFRYYYPMWPFILALALMIPSRRGLTANTGSVSNPAPMAHQPYRQFQA
jgi:hypothetical protein